MPDRLSDAEIQSLLTEPKSLPPNYRHRIMTKPKRGHNEGELELVGSRGSEFHLIVRQSASNPLDFSVILGYRLPQSNRIFRLRRYNGNVGEHTNRLEGTSFTGCHLHTATERYQDAGFDEETFAEPTARYSDLEGAMRCMLADCGFVLPSEDQLPLLEGEV